MPGLGSSHHCDINVCITYEITFSNSKCDGNEILTFLFTLPTLFSPVSISCASTSTRLVNAWIFRNQFSH